MSTTNLLCVNTSLRSHEEEEQAMLSKQYQHPLYYQQQQQRPSMRQKPCSPSGSLSDWSDPAAGDETASRQSALSVISDVFGSGQEDCDNDTLHDDNVPVKQGVDLESGRGVNIPAFLQPLLGIDFVPFMPASQYGSSKYGSDGHVIDAQERQLDLESNEAIDDKVSISSIRVETHARHDGANDFDLSIALEAPRDHTFHQLDDDSPGLKGEEGISRNGRKKFIASTIGATLKKIKKKAKRISLENSSWSLAASGRGPRKQRSHEHGSVPPPPSPLAVPHRRQDSNLQIMPMVRDVQEWMEEQRTLLEEGQQNLASIETQTHSLRVRAETIEDRASKTRREVIELQQALEEALQRLKHEEDSLMTAKKELNQLEEAANTANQKVLRAIGTIRGGYTASQPASPVVTPSSEADMFATAAGRRRFFTADCPSSDLQTSGSRHVHHMSLNEPIPDIVTPLRRRANTEPPRPLRRSECFSFIRASDLSMPDTLDCSTGQSSGEFSEPQLSLPNTPRGLSIRTPPPGGAKDDDFYFIDENMTLILDRLSRLAWAVAVDETSRFEPTHETRRLLAKNPVSTEPIRDWPVCPWHCPKSLNVLVWTGGVPHKGFGHDWPVVKARGIIHTSPRKLVEFLLDSTQIKKYNKMSQGREDVLVFQDDIDTIASESAYGFSGAAKITRALVKPKMLPHTIEMLSLWYAKPLPDAPGSYLIVNRSVWEDESWSLDASEPKGRVRSEMLLGVHLIRPCDKVEAEDDDNASNSCCEMTTITHVYSPGVPEIMAKRMTPGSSMNMFRDIQAIFPAPVSN